MRLKVFLTRTLASIFIISAFVIIFMQNKERNDSVSLQQEIEHFVLDNGMEVIILPNHRTKGILHMVWYRVGAIDEAIGKTGLAHYLEHLLFHGSKKYPKGKIVDIVESVGGSQNAFTGYNYTAYYQSIPKDSLDIVMDIEADRMHGVLFDESSVNNEKQIVLEERLLRIDNNPSRKLSIKMREALFGKNHPYGRPLIGFKEDIENLSSASVSEFYNKYYQPGNAILLLSGDVTKKEAMPLIDKYYAVLKPTNFNKISQVKIIPQNLAHKRIVTHYDKNIKTVNLKKYYLAPDLLSKNKKDAYALTLLSYLLGGNSNSILYQELVLNQKIALSVSTGYNYLSRGQTFFDISAVISDEENLKIVEDSIMKRIENIKLGNLDEEHLNRAKNLFRISSLYERESYISLGNIVGMHYTTGIDLNEIMQWDKKISQVTKDDIIAAANFVFNESKSVVGYLFPQQIETLH